MKNNFIFSVNHLLTGILIAVLIFKFREYTWLFSGILFFYYITTKNPVIKKFGFIYTTSFISLFLINNLQLYSITFNFDFVILSWPIILVFFTLISYLLHFMRFDIFINSLIFLKIKKQIIFVIITTILILKRIPIHIRLINEVFTAKRMIPKNVFTRIKVYPMMITPLIVSLLRDLIYYNLNYFTLSFYDDGIKEAFNCGGKILSSSSYLILIIITGVTVYVNG
jgi:hypothetical protein